MSWLIEVLTASPLHSLRVQTVSFKASATPLESSRNSLLHYEGNSIKILIMCGARSKQSSTVQNAISEKVRPHLWSISSICPSAILDPPTDRSTKTENSVLLSSM